MGPTLKTIDHSTEKWTKYFLDEDEIEILRRLKSDERIISCKTLFSTEVGLVTGRNEFFMMKEAQVKEWGVKDYTIPVISKSNQLKGISFTKNDFLSNSQEQKAVYLFLPPDEEYSKLPKVCKRYVKHGEKEEFHKGYKTRIRKRWYITPSRWVPDAFILRQVGEYPRIVLNESGASSTDTIHRVRFKEGIDKRKRRHSIL